jgi:hypothetical protein
MPLQNRVTPAGEIVADGSRGLMTGIPAATAAPSDGVTISTFKDNALSRGICGSPPTRSR